MGATALSRLKVTPTGVPGVWLVTPRESRYDVPAMDPQGCAVYLYSVAGYCCQEHGLGSCAHIDIVVEEAE